MRVEDARFQEVVTTYQNSVLSASQEVEDGIVGFVKALEATSVQQEAVTAARRSAELALIQYREGAADYERVLLADQTQLQQENNLVNLRSSVATNAISLYKALGGGWEMSVGQPFVPDATRIEMQKRTNWGNLFSTQPTTGSSTTSAPPPTSPRGKKPWPPNFPRSGSSSRSSSWSAASWLTNIGSQRSPPYPRGSCPATAVSKPSSRTPPLRSRSGSRKFWWTRVTS